MKHLCKYCYKRFNNPRFYVIPLSNSLETYSKNNEKDNKVRWYWIE